VTGYFPVERRRAGMGSPLAEQAMSVASRRSRVSRYLALTTQDVAVRRYEGVRAVK
jgi:hypothetical protein